MASVPFVNFGNSEVRGPIAGSRIYIPGLHEIWMGNVDTERSRAYYATVSETMRAGLQVESPQFTGRVIPSNGKRDQSWPPKPAELRTQIIRTPLNKFNLEMARRCILSGYLKHLRLGIERWHLPDEWRKPQLLHPERSPGTSACAMLQIADTSMDQPQPQTIVSAPGLPS